MKHRLLLKLLNYFVFDENSITCTLGHYKTKSFLVNLYPVLCILLYLGRPTIWQLSFGYSESKNIL